MNPKTKILTPFSAGCGLRRVGQAYMYTNFDQYEAAGYPLSYFLFDPPIRVSDPTAWGLCAQGISYVTDPQGIVNAQDWIGTTFYPNVADILEEILAHNASGLVPLNDGIKKLGPGSRRLLFHPHGWIENVRPYKQEYKPIEGRNRCPLPEEDPRFKLHCEINDQICAGLHWQVVEGGTPASNGGRYVQRKVGDTEYLGVRPLMEPDKPKYDLALVAWLPIDEIHVVGGDGTENQDAVEKALDLLDQVSNLPVFLTNV